MRIINKIKRLYGTVLINLQWAGRLILPFGKKVYFIATPSHENIGDNAIAMAEELFLQKCGFNRRRIKVFSQHEFTRNIIYAKKYIGSKHLICGIGGGNIGNQWYPEELFRYSVLDTFPENPIIIFPQTIYFTNDDNGKNAICKSYEHYEEIKDLTIVAREETSFALLKSLYSHPQKLLVPDIVLSTTMNDYGVSVSCRKGILLVFRNDEERNLTDDALNRIVEFLRNKKLQYHTTDMYSDIQVTKDNRDKLVTSKMQQFANSELVITDRLHGMIFSAITNTPCIVFGNYNHKIKETYDWISYLPYIKYVDKVEEAFECFDQLRRITNCTYNKKPLEELYAVLSKEIKQYVN